MGWRAAIRPASYFLDLDSASHACSTTSQVLASPALTKVVSILPEETMAVSRFSGNVAAAPCTYNSPTIPRVGTMVPEQHPGMATTLKHLKSHNVPPTPHMLSDLPIAPTM